MGKTLHPIHTTVHLRETYIHYLKTIKPFQDDRLRQEFAQALEEENLLLKGPYLEITPPFQTGKSIQELVREGILSQTFQELCHPHGLDYHRPLYHHQEVAVRKVHAGRNIVVTTGTGSGKTEAFLIPILDTLLRERQSGSLSQPGVRALLLYPMNALANDQMNRLRAILKNFPSITFGRYIGETLTGQQEATESYRELFQNSPFPDPLPNELLSRQQMQQTPPHILLTNYAMLEYLLLRPDDSPLFDGETGKHWRFIVLDEAHIYDGAQGTEIAMLLRRLQERITRQNQKSLQAIATSATLGDESLESLKKIVHFASQLLNLPFEWEVEDPSRQDVILGKRKPESELGDVWGEGNAQLYSQLASLADLWRQSPNSFKSPLPHELPEAPKEVTEKAAHFADNASDQAVPCYLYHILRGDKRLHQLRQHLREKPYKFNDISSIIFGELPKNDAQLSLANLVSAAILAKESPQSAPLLPARYHVFIRALEGAFVCLNTKVPEHQGADAKPILFLRRQKFCPHCGSRVFELANCTRCGKTYLIGNETPSEGITDEKYVLPGLTYLTQNSVLYPNEIEAKEIEYFSLEEELENIWEVDEDALIEEKADMENQADLVASNPTEICPRCGALHEPGNTESRCNCGVGFIRLAKINLKKGKTLVRCTSCSTYNKSGVIYRFLTGQDAPVSVLAGALYEHVPPARNEQEREYPGEGRKMLIFSDNRQQAAFFAAYLERAQKKILQRRLITTMLRKQAQFTQEEPLQFSDCLPPLKKLADHYGIFTETTSDKNKRIELASWLMQEFSGLDKRISLEGVGLLYFRPKFPQNWNLPEFITQPPWEFSEEEGKSLISVLLGTIRRQGAVTYFLEEEGIDLLSERQHAFQPRARLFYLRRDKAESRNNFGIYSWMPASSMKNTRLDYVVRLLECRYPQKSKEEIRKHGLDLLSELWLYLTGSASPVYDWWLKVENVRRLGILYRLKHDLWEVIPTLEDDDMRHWYVCERCQNLTPHNLENTCPTYGCRGKLQPLALYHNWISNNMYRYKYRNEDILPLEAEEHTAQWISRKAAEVQKDFIIGKINVLSSSTTFELGVDVGDLNAVIMRNVPPSSANYIQRAGRAGRRTDSVALVVTFAQRRPHDLTFYESPENMVAGRIRPPIVSLKNEKIIRRHLHSVVFATFFQWAKTKLGVLYRSIGDFFDPYDPTCPKGPSLIREFLSGQPSVIEQALDKVIPPDDELREALKLKNWGWVNFLINSEEAVLDKSAETIQGEIYEFRKLEKQASKERRHVLAEVYKQIQNQIRGRDLIGYLGSTNVLPKYGFPTDVVPLITHHLNIVGAKDIQLERDLQMAISEFAPGGQVVAAKRVWYSEGIIKRPQKLWPPYSYAVCPRCERMNVKAGESTISICYSCGESLDDNRFPRRSGKFIVPEFGFLASSNTDLPGEQPPERIYASRVYFSQYKSQVEGSEKDEINLIVDPEVSSNITVYKGYSRYGWLVRVNNGYGNGFRVCTICGYAEVIEGPRTNRRETTHNNPKTNEKCTGTLRNYHLGHRFMTDVLELHLQMDLVGEKTIVSVLYAILFGAVEALDIPVNEVDGVIYYKDRRPSFILYDNTPGGAGYVRMIYDNLYDVFEKAYKRVANCTGCGPDTSCYSCLRSYQNQNLHDKLERRLAWNVLGQILDKPLPYEESL